MDRRRWVGIHAVERWLFGFGILIVLFSIILPDQALEWYRYAMTFLYARPLFLGVIGMSLLYILFWKVPKWHVPADLEEKDHVDLEWKARQTMAQVIGGVILLGGLFFTAQTLRISQQTLYISQDGKITDRFAKSVEQLGSDNLTMRLGGIYSLSRIAKDSVEKDSQAVIDVLTAFVRNHAPFKERQRPAIIEQEIQIRSKPPTDIQAILTVIKKRTPGQSLIVDLHLTDLEGADLWGTDMLRADLREANLKAVNFHGALLRGVFFQGAHLEGANLQLSSLYGSDFEGAHLEGANLQHVILDSPDSLNRKSLFYDRTLRKFSPDSFSIRVEQEIADLRSADIGRANLKGANLKGTDLRGAKLQTVVNLTQEQVNQACVNESTELPAGIKKPQPCPK